jgi:predicted nucleic acid-binding protein
MEETVMGTGKMRNLLWDNAASQLVPNANYTVLANGFVIIAATVLNNGGTLVTRNTDEFSRIADLKLENWY